MNEPPFDDEDLIEDYYHEEEPPPGYDEEFEDEMADQAVESSRVGKSAKETNQVGGTVAGNDHTIMKEHITPLREVSIPPVVAFEENRYKSGGIADGISAQIKNKNLYSFDRCVDCVFPFFQSPLSSSFSRN